MAIEDLDVRGMMQLPSNSRNRASASWRTFIDFLEYKCEREGTHFVKVKAEGTTQECAEFGVEVEKELWVREYSCPTCGFEIDRDANAAVNIFSRGFKKPGL